MTAAVIAAIGALPAAGVRGSRSMTTGSYRIFNSGGCGGVQQPRQIDPILRSTFAFSRSMAGMLPCNRRPRRMSDGRAVPSELVPGAAGLVPNMPPVAAEDIECDPMLLCAKAMFAKTPTIVATSGTANIFMLKLPFFLGNGAVVLAVPTISARGG